MQKFLIVVSIVKKFMAAPKMPPKDKVGDDLSKAVKDITLITDTNRITSNFLFYKR